jgi:xanthine dehydrogenase YagT iron-sulfur-binding subunit
MFAELRRGAPSAVTGDRDTGELTDVEVRERMSGNLCRCGAYIGIRAAIQAAWNGTAR